MKTLLITDSDFGATDTNFSYLLGFQPSLGAIIFDTKEIAVFLDGRYFEKTKNLSETKITEIFGEISISYILVETTLIESIQCYLKDESSVELSDNISLKYSRALETNGIKIIPTKNPFAENRILKSQVEKENIKKAISIIDQVFEYIAEMIQNGGVLGKTELEIKKIVVEKIYEYGGEGESFGTIVAYGANSAIPHHQTGKTVILGEGVLLIDCGALYAGYPSDCTRTYWVGSTPSEEYKKVYDVVRSAHLHAYENAEIGIPGKDIDALARNYIAQSGYGECFIHGTGHGVGLDIHEAPFIGKSSKTKLKNEMVFTIEPGIYLAGKFGVRLEDIVYFENDVLKKWTSLDM